MKKLNFILIAALGMSAAVFTGCDEPPEIPPVTSDDGPETAVHNGLITEDETWTTEYYHELGSKVVVDAGVTLTIDAGVIIKGGPGTGSLATALIVARGGKLNANGTKENPIIFTSKLDNIVYGQKTGSNLTETDREKWGGLIILGKAPISAEDGDVEAQIEGIPADDAFGAFGGNDPADNSGSITYVSVRHAGALIGEGNEINGITLGGVGTGTVINHVEVIGNFDDGIECFGGTVNISNAIIGFQGDDGIDLDMNYAGTIDNFMVIHGGDTDEGLEIDGPEGTTNTSGLFTLKNGTIMSTDGKGSAGDFKSKAQGNVQNCVFTGYTTWLKIRANFDDANSCAPKSDAYKYMTDANAKLIFSGNEILNGPSSLDAAINAYTGVETCESKLDAAAQTALDVVFATNNSLVTSQTKGASASEFEGWTWMSANGKLN